MSIFRIQVLSTHSLRTPQAREREEVSVVGRFVDGSWRDMVRQVASGNRAIRIVAPGRPPVQADIVGYTQGRQMLPTPRLNADELDRRWMIGLRGVTEQQVPVGAELLPVADHLTDDGRGERQDQL